MEQTAAAAQMRHPFSRQPARCLLIDLTGDLSFEVATSISEGMTNFFSMVCNMKSGSARIPYFCMLSLSSYVEVCYAMQRVTKLSYHKIETALKEIVQYSCSKRKVTSSAGCKGYEHAFYDAASQFQKVKAVTSVTKLSLSIITCQNPKNAKSSIVQALKKVSGDIFNKIEVYCFCENGEDLEMECQSGPSPFEDYDHMSSVNINVIERDCISVESVFHNWLHDSNTDYEHLHLMFPKTGLKIKCDLKERLIDLSEFHLRENINIAVHSFNRSSSDMGIQTSSFKSSYGMPIFELQVVKRIDLADVCESTVFGRPYIISSSSCWRMNWDELECNRSQFSALCHSLFVSGKCLLCENLTRTVARSSAASEFDNNEICSLLCKGIFIIMAGPRGSSLLLKSIASREITFLNKIQENVDVTEQSVEILQKMNEHLSEVPTIDFFNPLDYNAGLIGLFKNTLKMGGRQSSVGGSHGSSASPQVRTKVTSFNNSATAQGSKNLSFVQPRSSFAEKNEFAIGEPFSNHPKTSSIKTTARAGRFPSKSKKSVKFAHHT